MGKTLILSIESGSMCKHQGSSKQSGFYSPVSCGEQNPVWNSMAIHPLLVKKENNSAEKEGFLLLPFHLDRHKENGNIESRILHHAL